MSVTGEPGRGPVRAGIAVADMTAGNLLALAIMMDFQAARYLMDADVPAQVGNGHPTLVPTGTYPTRDGHVNIAPSSPKQWKTFCEVVGKPEWLENPAWCSFDARRRERSAIDAAIALQTCEQPTAYWVERLERAGIPCGPIYRMDEVFADPQIQHLEMSTRVPHPERGEAQLIASPLNFEGTSKAIRSAATIEVAPMEEPLRERR